MISMGVPPVGSLLERYVSEKTIPSLFSLFGEAFSYAVRGTHNASASNLDLLIPHSEKLRTMSGAYVRCWGDIHFGVLWYVPEEDLRPLTKKMLGHSQMAEIEKLTASSMSEIGNMLTASILNALSDESGCSFVSTVPGYALESLNVLLDGAMSDFGCGSDSVMASTVEFQGIASGFSLRMLLLVDPEVST